ncbi:hypothetical protein [uncultured Eudoraea sp.]|uniref:hypothetical protein n=1 Tax=uncultured Eudoraea sp. TaxID=1035614 RepID=UPI00262D9E3D|nr:hypothetical protein [uncultured Eudoraea sp.]
MNSIGIFSFAKFQAFLFSLIGLLAGILYSFGGLIIDTLVSLNWITSEETDGLSFGTMLAFIALIGMPLIFGIVGFFAGILEAFLYNTVVKWFPIFKMDFDHN